MSDDRKEYKNIVQAGRIELAYERPGDAGYGLGQLALTLAG